MSRRKSEDNRVRMRRLARGWSQADLAEAAGISRTAVSAIEGERLVPSVAAALSVARSLGCTVEELFGTVDESSRTPSWAWPPPAGKQRYWMAEVGGRPLLFPAETVEATGHSPHDGTCGPAESPADESPLARQTLVVACCDPAAGLLATCYERQSGFRMIVLHRSSQRALDLLQRGLVHVAGLHLSHQGDVDHNGEAVRSKFDAPCRLLRIATWEEGLAVAPGAGNASVRSLVRSRRRWVGREPGSGARQCLDELLPRGTAPRRLAHDHRGVAEAIRCGWADVGVCLRLACEEARLQFVPLRDEYFELCFPADSERDPRIQALVRVVRSGEYRRILGDLPGYGLHDSGGVRSAT